MSTNPIIEPDQIRFKIRKSSVQSAYRTNRPSYSNMQTNTDLQSMKSDKLTSNTDQFTSKSKSVMVKSINRNYKQIKKKLEKKNDNVIKEQKTLFENEIRPLSGKQSTLRTSYEKYQLYKNRQIFDCH